MTNVPSAVVLAGIRKTPGIRREGIHEAVFHPREWAAAAGPEKSLSHTHVFKAADS